MKQAKSISMYLLASVLAVMACAFAAPASAATYSHTFAATTVNGDAAAFPIDVALTVAKEPNVVKVTTTQGTTYTYADPTGALHVKLLNYMANSMSGAWYHVPGTQVSVNLTVGTQVTCSGTTTYFGFPLSGGFQYGISDGCAARNAVVAGSN
jgi:hypothetical protein